MSSLGIYNMKGGGYYNQHSSPQRQSIEQVLPWLEDAIADLEVSPTVRTLDVGCSEGGNAIYAQKRIIAKLLERGAECVQPSFADLPSNDFNTVFGNFFPDGESAFGDRVLPAAIAGSAYNQLVPDQSIHIATTYNMLGFRATPPIEPLHHTIAALSPTPYGPARDPAPDPEEIATFTNQAKPDLLRFFRARAKELIPGGKMLVQTFGNNDEGVSTAHGWIDAINDALLAMMTEGKLPPNTIDDYNFPVVYWQLKDVVEPLTSTPDLREAFHIERQELLEVPVAFNQAFAESGDVATWSAAYCAFIRAITETTLSHALPTDNRAELVEEVYARVQKLMAGVPERYQYHYYSIALLVTRK